jgi:hypothetical protein
LVPEDCKEVCPEQDWDCEDYMCERAAEPAAEPKCSVDQDCEDLLGPGWECSGGTCTESETECSVNQDCEDLYGEGWECTGGTCAEAEEEPGEEKPTPTPTATPTALPPQCANDHDCTKPEVGLHCCDDAACHDCCYDMHCEADEVCVDYECVKKTGPEELVVLLDGYYQTGNWQGLYDRLHPAVIEWCGILGSREWVQDAAKLGLGIEFISAEQVAWWFHLTQFLDAWEVRIKYVVAGQESEQVIHFVEYDDSLRFFIPCEQETSPAPEPPDTAPPEEEEVPPAPAPPPSEGSVLMDPPGDPVNCIDWSAIPDPQGYFPDTVRVERVGTAYYITYAEELTEETWGGIQFYFPEQPLITDSDWYFDTVGNLSINYMYAPPSTFETYVTYVAEGEWQVSDLVPVGGVDGKTVRIEVPSELESVLPQYWPISGVMAGVSGTNMYFDICDKAGYGLDDLPEWKHWD